MSGEENLPHYCWKPFFCTIPFDVINIIMETLNVIYFWKLLVEIYIYYKHLRCNRLMLYFVHVYLK
jgi:hypothetical protein